MPDPNEPPGPTPRDVTLAEWGRCYQLLSEAAALADALRHHPDRFRAFAEDLTGVLARHTPPGPPAAGITR
jgi:hypothetical protein